MEENVKQSTPMGRVWLVVLISATFVLGASEFWHLRGIHSLEMQGKKDNQKMITNIARLSGYRDALKEGGKKGGVVYIEQLQKIPYGI